MELLDLMELATFVTKRRVANCAQVGKPASRIPAGASASHAQPAITRAQKNRLRGAVRLEHLRLPSPIAEFAATAER